MSLASEYNYSRPLDVNKRSEYKDLLAITKEVWGELYPSVSHTRGASNKKKFNHLRVIIIDLIKAHREDPAIYLGYSRNRNSYSKGTRNHKLCFKYSHLINVVDSLKDHGFIEDGGWYFDRVIGAGRQSRMRAAQKLTDLVSEHPDIPEYELNLKDIEKEQLVVISLKEKKWEFGKKIIIKKLVPVKETSQIKKMQKQLVAYNKLLNKTFIDIDLEGYTGAGDVTINLSNKLVKRIFNDKNCRCGGRYYGGWWQNINRELRNRIILGETFKRYYEKDYSALHIVLLYAKEGISYFDKYGIESDPYDLGEFEGYEPNLRKGFRKIFKRILLVCLNTRRKGNAKNVIFNELEESPEDFESISLTKEQIANAIDLFIDKHAPIKHHLFQRAPQGVTLQNIDSKIASEIIDNFIHRNIPVLCMHDSFICTERDSYELDTIMDDAIKKVVKTEYGLTIETAKLKPMYYYGYQEIDAYDTCVRKKGVFLEDDIKEIMDEMQCGIHKRYSEWLINKYQYDKLII